MRLAEALQRTVIFCKWLGWQRCLGGESRDGTLLLLPGETVLQGWGILSFPSAGVFGWVAVVSAWSLEDSVVEVRIPGCKHLQKCVNTFEHITTSY